MTLTELHSILRSTNYPVAYSHFKSEPSIPFITYLETHTSNIMADNKVYFKIKNAKVELYTNKKDLQAEKQLEDVFEQYEIPWNATETYIESEKLYQRIYEIKLF